MLLTLSPNLVPFSNKKTKGNQLAFNYCYQMIRQFSNRCHDGFGNCRGLKTQYLKMIFVIQKTIKKYGQADKCTARNTKIDPLKVDNKRLSR